MPRVAIAGFLHESNTFNAALTELAAFDVQRGEAIAATWGAAPHEIGGLLEGAGRAGLELVPTLLAQAVPSGTVAAGAFEVLAGEIVAQALAARPLDGLLLALHGAMASEEYLDADGEVVRRLRAALGQDFPIVVTHDFHANLSQQIVRDSTALVVYQTNPHLDQRECGLKAAGLMARILLDGVRPAPALAKPPMLLNIMFHNTSAEPLRSLMQSARDLEAQPGILAASLVAGYQYADVYEMGPSAIVVTDGDPALAEREAQRLASGLWEARESLRVALPDAEQAVRQARASDQTPVVLVDTGDNIGGGSAGDGTCILAELLRQGAESWVVVLADAQAVQMCARAGIGARLALAVGGKHDRLHGDTLEVTGRVKCLHDGQYAETETRHGGRLAYDQGLTAVLEVAASPRRSAAPSLVVLTSRREVPFSLHQLLSLGIQPQRHAILVVKAAIAYRAAYEPIAGRIIEVDTPGLTAVNPARFDYRRVRRPLWGIP
jgi:microcystin degradation protein MlrC